MMIDHFYCPYCKREYRLINYKIEDFRKFDGRGRVHSLGYNINRMCSECETKRENNG